MSDRTNGFIVTLEREMRVDDAEATIAAIRQIKGVLSVDPVVTKIADFMAYNQARHDIARKLWKALEEDKTGIERK